MKQILFYPGIIVLYFIFTYIILEVVSRFIKNMRLKCSLDEKYSEKVSLYSDDSFKDDYILGVLKFSFLSMVIFIFSIMGYSVLLLDGYIPGNGDLCLAFIEFFAGIVVQLIYFLSKCFVLRNLPRLDRRQILFIWFVVIIILAIQFNKMGLPAQRNICITILFSYFFWIGLPGVSFENCEDFKDKIKAWFKNIIAECVSYEFHYVLGIVIVFLSIVVLENSSNNILYMIFAAVGCGFGIGFWWKCFQHKEKEAGTSAGRGL